MQIASSAGRRGCSNLSTQARISHLLTRTHYEHQVFPNFFTQDPSRRIRARYRVTRASRPRGRMERQRRRDQQLHLAWPDTDHEQLSRAGRYRLR